ncbi:VanZ family protein [Lactiplantibacillus daowaiensis]|uniref:VanZ family protein n=1 Tax=Lactiplantibacillus daowaiensis TaxID=2559918 RepID=A0ABW1S2Z4_9LACO|nr:VanZ family protein [Lactiplantibacillus daowaiensis]
MLAWLPFIVLTSIIASSALYLNRHLRTPFIKLKRLTLLSFIWILTAFCYTPTAYNFSGTVIIQYLTWGPVKLTLVPFQHLDIEFWLNVLLTMPLGFLISWNWPQWTWRKIVGLGLLTGLTLESGQFILDWLVHLNRWVEVDDVLTNWTGVILGSLSYRLLARRTWFNWR